MSHDDERLHWSIKLLLLYAGITICLLPTAAIIYVVAVLLE